MVSNVARTKTMHVGIGAGMEVDVRTEIGLRLVVVSSFVH